MAIRINLLAEALAEEDLRRRDPVKRAIFVGALLVALSLVWFSSTWLEFMLEKKGLSQIQQERSSKTNDYNQVQGNLRKIADAQRRLDSLQLLSASRFLQGNLLNAMQQIYVPNVQLTRLRVEQTYTVKEGPPPVTNELGAVTVRPGTATERIRLLLDAKDFSPNPGDQVNRYKSTLAAQEFFKANLEPTNGVKLSNLSPPQTALGSKPFVLLTLECRFSDKIR
jgi:hypothetical protein